MSNTTFGEVISRISTEKEYLLALGACVLQLISAEWNAAYCCERMQPDYIRDVSDPDQRIMARNIAEKLVSLTKNLPDSDDKSELTNAADIFLSLVKEERNFLYHSHPISYDGKTALKKNQRIFTIEELKETTVRAFDCSGVLNKSLHGFLRQP
ncbi:hypothetical protein [Leucothrix arctica]|uniref:Uncharacterized protein n=1 Tax=Leucothrix arctica TaxID=1481894 RepID=A0A317CJF0_9GAMM|nr:hypothetical protein [Leucothrix arctica]PWQ97563.1 hypothetical protein DKT75_06495 [Leucothrix arctica]